MDHAELHSNYTDNVVVSATREAVTVNASDANGDRDTAADVDLTLSAGLVALFAVICEGPAGTDRKFKVPLGSDGYRNCHVEGDSLEVPGHGLLDDETIGVFQLGAAAVPTNLTEGNVAYYVEVVDANTINLHTAAGGASQVTGIGAGTCRITKMIPHGPHGADSTVTVQAGTTVGIGS